MQVSISASLGLVEGAREEQKGYLFCCKGTGKKVLIFCNEKSSSNLYSFFFPEELFLRILLSALTAYQGAK